MIELKIGKKENGKMYYKKETVSDELFRNIYSVLCCSYYTLGLFRNQISTQLTLDNFYDRSKKSRTSFVTKN